MCWYVMQSFKTCRHYAVYPTTKGRDQDMEKHIQGDFENFVTYQRQ